PAQEQRGPRVCLPVGSAGQRGGAPGARAGSQTTAGDACRVSPQGTSCRRGLGGATGGCQDRDDRGELLRSRIPGQDSQGRAPGTRLRGLLGAHSGMFPCLRGGRVSRLVARVRSALITSTRVSDGAITASTYPRSAAI